MPALVYGIDFSVAEETKKPFLVPFVETGKSVFSFLMCKMTYSGSPITRTFPALRAYDSMNLWHLAKKHESIHEHMNRHSLL